MRLLFHHFAQVAQVKSKLELGWPVIQERTCGQSKCTDPSTLTLLVHQWLGGTEYRYTGSVNIESDKEHSDTLWAMEIAAHSYGSLGKVKEAAEMEEKVPEATDQADSKETLEGQREGQRDGTLGKECPVDFTPLTMAHPYGVFSGRVL